MSFDIIVIKPSTPEVGHLDCVREAIDLGASDAVQRDFEALFPGATRGLFFSGEEYSLEVSLVGEPVRSAHIALRFGATWSEHSHNRLVERLGELCRRLQCVAFATSDNIRLAP